MLDTHTAVWHLLGSTSLSQAAVQAIDRAVKSGSALFVPSITLVELVYLIEKDRLSGDAFDRLTDLLEDPASNLTLLPLGLDIVRTLPHVSREEVPDMPDHIIAASALYLDVPLITRDRRIQMSSVTTIW